MISDKRFCKLAKGPTYKLHYWLYTAEGQVSFPTKDTIAKEQSAQEIQSICFRDFLTTVGSSKLNRLAFSPKIHDQLDKKQTARWIELSTQYKLMPSYITPECLDKYFVIDFKDMSPSEIYIYLCQIRHMEEWPDVVRVALILVDEYNIDPYLAMCAGSAIGCGNNGHNYISVDYYEGESIRPHVAVALKEYLREPSCYDKRRCNIRSKEYFPSFNSTDKILVASRKHSLPTNSIPIANVDDPQLAAVMNAKSIAEAKKILCGYFNIKAEAA